MRFCILIVCRTSQILLTGQKDQMQAVVVQCPGGFCKHLNLLVYNLSATQVQRNICVLQTVYHCCDLSAIRLVRYFISIQEMKTCTQSIVVYPSIETIPTVGKSLNRLTTCFDHQSRRLSVSS